MEPTTKTINAIKIGNMKESILKKSNNPKRSGIVTASPPNAGVSC